MNLTQDLRYTLRWLLKSPGFTAAAVLTLALGIGANSAIFSVVNAVLLRPLPYPQSDRLVRIWDTNDERGEEGANVNPNTFLDWRQNARSFESMAGFVSTHYALAADGGEPERVPGYAVTSSFFPLLGARALHGRTFLPGEDRPGSPRLVLLSHQLWVRRFRSDPDIVGKTLTMERSPYTIVGVMPADFRSPQAESDPPQLWTPLRIEPEMGRGGHWMGALGRLAPGVTLARAQAEMSTLAAGLEKLHPETNTGWRPRLQDLKDSMVGNTRAPLLLLLASVGLVLLIACANVTNLLLARAAVRQKEITVRLALGATSRRLVRQLLTESVLLSLLGGAAGLLLARWMIALLVRLSSASLPRMGEIGIDGRVLALTFFLSLLTGLAFGLAPALWSVKTDLASALQESGGKNLSETGGRRLPKALIVAETAVALVLLVGAGLLIKSFWNLTRVEAGFNPRNLLTVEIELPNEQYEPTSSQAAFYQELIARVRALPGAQQASAVDILPFSGNFSCNSFSVEDGSSPHANELAPCAEYRTVGPEYFRTMEIPILRGRGLLATDRANSARVAVINETLARKLWPDLDPIGRTFTLHFMEQEDHEVVGVIRDIRHFGLDVPTSPEIYVSHLQHPTPWMTLTVRSTSDPAALIAAIRREIRELDPQLPVNQVATMEDNIYRSVAQPRLRTVLLVVFASIALILAAVGIFGVIAWSVSRRTHEIGLRMALGADRARVLALVVGQAMGSALLGLTFGLALSLFSARQLTRFLYEVTATDWAVFVACSLLLTLVALLASLLPARRASRLAPAVALRQS